MIQSNKLLKKVCNQIITTNTKLNIINENGKQYIMQGGNKYDFSTLKKIR